MNWLVKSLVLKLRSNAALANWTGLDADGNPKIYHDNAPSHVKMVSTEHSFRYITFNVLPGDSPLRTYGGKIIERWHVQFNIIDNISGGSDDVAVGYELLIAALGEYQCWVSILDSGLFPEYHTISVFRSTPLRGPERNRINGMWWGSVDYIIQAQRLIYPSPSASPSPSPSPSPPPMCGQEYSCTGYFCVIDYLCDLGYSCDTGFGCADEFRCSGSFSCTGEFGEI